MQADKIIMGIILIGMGILFFFNNNNIGKGAYKFYRKLYTEKNLIVMFKLVGILLLIAGIIILVTK